MKTIILIFTVAMFIVNGCVSSQIKSTYLKVEVKPVNVRAGDIVTVEVFSTVKLKEVSGRLELFGSPIIPLKQISDKQWIWRTQVPLEAVLKSGKYHVLIEGKTVEGEILSGESWVETP